MRNYYFELGILVFLYSGIDEYYHFSVVFLRKKHQQLSPFLHCLTNNELFRFFFYSKFFISIVFSSSYSTNDEI